jgi:hypothetical protein
MMKHSLWKNIRGYFRPECETIIPAPSRKLRLSGKEIRIPFKGYQAYRVEMGKQVLTLYPDPGVAENERKAQYDFILFDPDRYFTGIAHWQRLSPGETLSIDRHTEYQEYVFSSPREAFRRHFSVTHEGNALIFRDPIAELGTYVSVIDDTQEVLRITARRTSALLRVAEIFGGPLESLTPGEKRHGFHEIPRTESRNAPHGAGTSEYDCATSCAAQDRCSLPPASHPASGPGLTCRCRVAPQR